MARRKKVSFSMKTMAARKHGKCASCRGTYYAGEPTTVVRFAVKRYHPQCAPLDPVALLKGSGAASAPPPPPTYEESALGALLLLEKVMVEKAQKFGVTPELEKSFDKYQKLKAVALRPGTSGEERAALRFAVLEAVKLAF